MPSRYLREREHTWLLHDTQWTAQSLETLRSKDAAITVRWTILQHFCYGSLKNHILFRTTQNLAVDTLLGTSSIVGFICGILPFEPTVVSWHSQPVAISGKNVKRMGKPTIGIMEENPEMNIRQPAEDGNDGLVQAADQIVLKELKQHPVLVTKTSNDLPMIDAEQVFLDYPSVAAANDLTDIL